MKPQGRNKHREPVAPRLTEPLRNRPKRSSSQRKNVGNMAGGWMPENISGVPAGGSVFHLTSPFIGLLNTCGGYWTHRQSLCLRCFLRFLSTEAPSLHRHYPVSSVLRGWDRARAR